MNLTTLLFPSVELALVGPKGSGWTEAPYAKCGDCRLVFADEDLTYNYGADDWLCPTCLHAPNPCETNPPRTATVDDIVRRLTGTPYATTAETALGWGMGAVQLGIGAALTEAIATGLVRLVDTRDTTYGRGVRFVCVAEAGAA